MAVTTESGLLSMLKVFYAKEGLMNLLFRNDEFLKTIKKQRVEGKTQNFSALYTRGGAVSATWTKAKALATQTAQAKEFAIEPGQLFSAAVFNNKELLASRTLRGAYLPIASAKMFANAESFRKTLAVALYGSGHGELFTTTGSFAMSAATEVVQTWPTSAIMGIDIGSQVEYKVSPAATAIADTAVVTAIDMANKAVTVVPASTATLATGGVVCIAGCTDNDGRPMLPVGLGGWLPSTAPASTDNFFGVNRSVAPDRLAGTRYAAPGGEAKYVSLQNAILSVSRYGSRANVIIMNDADRLALAKEVENKTYFTKANGGDGKSAANVGYGDIGIAVNKNFLDTVIGSPYCPAGTGYVLDSDTVELWTFSNADKIDDGAADPYKPEVNGENTVQDKPYQMMVDDLFTIQPGTDTADGPAAVVGIMFYGEFVVTNPSMNAVVKFAA